MTVPDLIMIHDNDIMMRNDRNSSKSDIKEVGILEKLRDLQKEGGDFPSLASLGGKLLIFYSLLISQSTADFLRHFIEKSHGWQALYDMLTRVDYYSFNKQESINKVISMI